MLLQNLSQRQQLKILPQQIQLLNIFHLTTLELEQHIQMELENNPVLEEVSDADGDKQEEVVNEYADWEEYVYEDIPDYKTEYANYFPAESIPEKPIADEIDFRKSIKEQLKWQIEDPEQYDMALYMVDSLNDSGFLDMPLENIAENISFSEKRWIEADDLLPILNHSFFNWPGWTNATGVLRKPPSCSPIITISWARKNFHGSNRISISVMIISKYCSTLSPHFSSGRLITRSQVM